MCRALCVERRVPCANVQCVERNLPCAVCYASCAERNLPCAVCYVSCVERNVLCADHKVPCIMRYVLFNIVAPIFHGAPEAMQRLTTHPHRHTRTRHTTTQDYG